MQQNKGTETVARIRDLSSTPQDIIVAMADGNPGAVSVMVQMFRDAPLIDPDNMFEGFGSVLFLDTLGIYGSHIWILYKDVCGERIDRTLAVLRAVQLGLLSDTDLKAAINGDRQKVDVGAVFADVRQRLPNFAPATRADA